tara:strand:+ start:940 stop:1161 length:222 start_codon:yes stop_codon:yes gene_type:complete
MKLNKKQLRLAIFLSVLLVGLTGCSDAPTAKEFEIASKWCDDFGGVESVTSGGLSGLRARCNDSKLIIDDQSH